MSRPGLRQHPKFKRALLTLRVPAPHLAGYLDFIWSVSYEAGDPIIGDSTDIELAAEWPGESGKLTQALLDCGGPGRSGFIEPVPGDPLRFQIHDLYDHCPEYVKARARREAERCARGKSISDVRREAIEKRWNNENKEVIDTNDSHLNATTKQAYTNETTPAPAPAPAPNKYTLAAQGSSEPQASPATSLAAEPPLLVFDCAGGKTSKARTWALTQSHVEMLADAYPDIDVLAQAKEARVWTIANSKKTADGMLNFLRGWMGRAQNDNRKGSNNGHHHRKTVTATRSSDHPSSRSSLPVLGGGPQAGNGNGEH